MAKDWIARMLEEMQEREFYQNMTNERLRSALEVAVLNPTTKASALNTEETNAIERLAKEIDIQEMIKSFKQLEAKYASLENQLPPKPKGAGVFLHNLFFDPKISTQETHTRNQMSIIKDKIVSIDNEIESIIAGSDILLHAQINYWRKLKDVKLERALAKLFSAHFKIPFRLTAQVADGGIDLEGHSNQEVRILVQAKGWAKPVGQPVIREFLGSCAPFNNIKKRIVVGTGGFTKPAKDFANSNGIILIDSQELASMGEKVVSGD